MSPYASNRSRPTIDAWLGSIHKLAHLCAGPDACRECQFDLAGTDCGFSYCPGHRAAGDRKTAKACDPLSVAAEPLGASDRPFHAQRSNP